jgi:hypothetical protein
VTIPDWITRARTRGSDSAGPCLQPPPIYTAGKPHHSLQLPLSFHARISARLTSWYLKTVMLNRLRSSVYILMDISNGTLRPRPRQRVPLHVLHRRSPTRQHRLLYQHRQSLPNCALVLCSRGRRQTQLSIVNTPPPLCLDHLLVDCVMPSLQCPS